ncbi:MAG: ComF family protein [Patescibacteria group bacterium]|nr:MAG: ComF family protein [Patescibacteria group bacterium]
MLKKLFHKILDMLFPRSCAGCNTPNTVLCDKCIADLPPAGNTEDIDIVSVFDYRNETIKKTIWLLKYKGSRDVGRKIAGAVHDRLLEELHERSIFSNFHDPILIPIPLSKKRAKARGFNQSEIIAREMSFIDNCSSFTLATNVLYKTKDTPSQVSIKNREKRLRNLKGCFFVKAPLRVKNRSIILIDDITTTGATISEARETLLAAGARNVIAFTVAH